jgi:sulfur-oxidizing protein SoxY
MRSVSSALRIEAMTAASAHHRVASRRKLLGSGATAALLLACGLLTPRAARAAEAGISFDDLSIPDALARIGARAADVTQLRLTVPQVAEDGALVPVTLESLLPATRELYIVVDVNPDPLAARFSVPTGTEPFVATRIKMASDGTVYAVATDAEGRIHVTSQAMKVTTGGCA